MENRPNPLNPEVIDKETTEPAISSSPAIPDAFESDPAGGTSELSTYPSTENTERFEPRASQQTLDGAEVSGSPAIPVLGRVQNRPTPIIELLRSATDRYVHVRKFEVTDNDIAAIGKQHTGFDLRLPPTLYRTLLLPTRLKKCQSAREMFDRIRNLIRNQGILSERQCRLVTYWSMASWFTDYLPFIPTLVVTGPAFAADPLLRLLQCVCRRPVLLAGISPASFRAITYNEVMPTLLIRAAQMNKTMVALLDASNQPGYFVSSGKDLWQYYGAKCIYIGETGNQQIAGTRSIHVHVGSRAAEVSRLLPPSEVVQDLQNQMLYYRLVAHDRVVSSTFKVTGFLPELCAMAQVLGAPLEDDPELQVSIIDLLKEFDEQVRVDRSGELSAMVLRAVLVYCHQPDQEQVFVREIAATANELYREEGESIRISNERVGHVLKSLGLYTRRLGNAGRRLRLDQATQIRVHELSHANEVLPESEGIICGHCHKLQILETQEGV